MANVSTRDVAYEFGGLRMSGFFACADGGGDALPGVIVVPEAFGLGEHAMKVARRLAESGYAALAMDLWGERRLLDGLAEAQDKIPKLAADSGTWMGRVEATRQALIAQPEVDASRTAAIGYCFGGATVLEFARTGGDVSGVMSFHGGLDAVGTEWSGERTRAKIVISTGIEDPMVPMSTLAALRDNFGSSTVDWEMDIYSGTKHSYTNPDADSLGMPEALAYNAQADKRSWNRLLDFLDEIF